MSELLLDLLIFSLSNCYGKISRPFMYNKNYLNLLLTCYGFFTQYFNTIHKTVLNKQKNIRNYIDLSLISFSKYMLLYLFTIVGGLFSLFIICIAIYTTKKAKNNLEVVMYLQYCSPFSYFQVNNKLMQMIHIQYQIPIKTKTGKS